MSIRIQVKERIKTLLKQRFDALKPPPNWNILKQAKGIIHVGANTGQEREIYRKLNLNVCWFEADTIAYKQLLENIQNLPIQKAICALVGNEEGSIQAFHRSSNLSCSSSIKLFKRHPEVWPEVVYERTDSLEMRTLDSLVHDYNLTSSVYDMLILDVQGAELEVLMGATATLGSIRWIQLPVPDFEGYEKAADQDMIESFLFPLGYKLKMHYCTGSYPGVGSTFEFIYEMRERESLQ